MQINNDNHPLALGSATSFQSYDSHHIGVIAGGGLGHPEELEECYSTYVRTTNGKKIFP